MQQGRSSSAGSAGAVATLTDEQIIGLDPLPADDAASVAQGAPAAARSVAQGADAASASDPEALSDDLSAGDPDPAENPQGRGQEAAAHPELQNFAATRQADPDWLRALEAQPQGGREAAAEARAWRAAAGDVASLDAAYFSAEPGARAGLAARLYDSDPAAFRAMLAESARVIAQRDPQALAELARQLGAPAAAPAPPSVARVARQTPENFVQTDAARNPRLFSPANPEDASGLPTTGRPELQNPVPATRAFPADAYRFFEAATNDDVARRVHQAIDHTLANTLPDGTAEGARRRITADIFQEVQTALSADRDLSRRVGETLRDWRFDAAARQQVAGLLSGRARAVLPEVARRVITEWTSSVLTSDRAKTARIEAAAARREVTGGRMPEPVPASALRPRNIDYRRVSDAQILDM